MSRPEARAEAAERRRSRIKEEGGRLLQIALRAGGSRALEDLQERSGKGPSAIIEELLIKACSKQPRR